MITIMIKIINDYIQNEDNYDACHKQGFVQVESTSILVFPIQISNSALQWLKIYLLVPTLSSLCLFIFMFIYEFLSITIMANLTIFMSKDFHFFICLSSIILS